MRQPLDTIYVTGEFKEKAVPGTGLPDAAGIRRHIGVDLRATIGTKVYAPGSGVVTASYASSAGQTIEIRIAGKLWRFMHLSKRHVSVGQSVSEGQVIALSGNSGGVAAHLHVDVRKDGTVWNASLNNYSDFRSVIADAAKPKLDMPAVGSVIQLIPKDTRTTFKAGTTNVAGKIDVKDNTYTYVVRGYDSKYPGRILMNSASAGGNGVALALYYTDGRRIEGWKQV